MRNTNEQSLKQVINEIMHRQKLKGKLSEVRIRDSWEKVMGPTIANRTTELKLKDNILSIRINSAPLRHELTYNLDRVKQLLNEEIGEAVISQIILL